MEKMMISDQDIESTEKLLLPDEGHFQEDAREVIRCWHSVDVAACPGSGKTTVLLAKLKLLADRMPLENGAGICVLSHTNVAVDEVRGRLSDYADRLLAYPNYIGTIQSFIDRFVTIPYLRNITGRNIQVVDDLTYAQHMLKRMQNNAKYRALEYVAELNFTTSSHGQFKNRIEHIQALSLQDDGSLKIGKQKRNFAGADTKTTHQYNLLIYDLLRDEGIIRYKDAYKYAQKAVSQLSDTYKALFSARFRYVFIDEYQDCDDIQRRAIDTIFDATKCTLFKIGDSDQAIYNSSDEETLDWVPKDGYLSIMTSCRYSQEIANVICKLRKDNEKIVTFVGETGIKPVLIIFEPERIGRVLEEFVNVLETHGDHEHMGYKRNWNEIVYLPDCFTGKISNDLRRCHNADILYWDFTKKIECKVKIQIRQLLNHIVRTIKKEEKRNQYLFFLKNLYGYVEERKISDILKLELFQEKEYDDLLKKNIKRMSGSSKNFISFCRETLFIKNKEIDWNANVWYVEKLDISLERFPRGNNIKSFSFLNVLVKENRKSLQLYIKYLLRISSLNLITIRIFHIQAMQFLKYLEEKNEKIDKINVKIVRRYFEKLMSENIKPQSYNNKIKNVTDFLIYLQHIEMVKYFEIPADFYMKRVYASDNFLLNLEEKIELFCENVYDFPMNLGLMSCILIYTGIDKSKMFYLKDTDFFYKKDDSWMSIPGENRSIPIPEALHWMVLKFIEVKQIPLDSYMFLEHNEKSYTYESFQRAIMKQCEIRNILKGEYIFKGNGYQIALCQKLYRAGTPIQTIREYMGYVCDETVKKNLKIIEQKVMDASKMYFERNKGVLEGIPMAKYDKMIEENKRENQRKVKVAIDEIKKIESEGKKVLISEVAARTGLSRSFFYKNDQVRSVLDEMNQNHKNERFTFIKEEVKNKSLERQNEYFKKQLEEVIAENEELKAENRRLREIQKVMFIMCNKDNGELEAL